VVFRRVDTVKEKTRGIRCGLVLIDITAQDHVKLLAMLHQVQNRNSYVCNDLDLDALWDFLFEAGFIYPKKYALIHASKEQIKQTYQKLYTRSPEIARHFVYQDNGTILGHLATIRFWKNSWLIHHHAARKSALNRAGLIVLDQIGRFGHDTYRLRGLHLDYLVCYYQPQNRFPSRVFGGAAKFINNRQGCSVDALAYMAGPAGGDGALSLPPRWEFGRAESTDVADLECLYDRVYGGPMLKALDLQSTTWQDDELCQEFRKCGFRRERHLFTLKKDGSSGVSDCHVPTSDSTPDLTNWSRPGAEPKGPAGRSPPTRMVRRSLVRAEPCSPSRDHAKETACHRKRSTPLGSFTCTARARRISDTSTASETCLRTQPAGRRGFGGERGCLPVTGGPWLGLSGRSPKV
jgi:hypothetical protein